MEVLVSASALGLGEITSADTNMVQLVQFDCGEVLLMFKHKILILYSFVTKRTDIWKYNTTKDQNRIKLSM